MTREEKQQFVVEVRERLERADAVFLTDFTGLDVKAITHLRSEVRRAKGQFLVVKNRLLRRALEDMNGPDLSNWLTGPTGVVFSDETVVDSARVIVDFAKENEGRPVFKVGLMETTVLLPEDFARVSKLPSRDELLSQVAGALEAPLSAFASVIEGKTREFVGLLDALRQQSESSQSGESR